MTFPANAPKLRAFTLTYAPPFGLLNSAPCRPGISSDVIPAMNLLLPLYYSSTPCKLSYTYSLVRTFSLYFLYPMHFYRVIYIFFLFSFAAPPWEIKWNNTRRIRTMKNTQKYVTKKKINLRETWIFAFFHMIFSHGARIINTRYSYFLIVWGFIRSGGHCPCSFFL